MNPRLDDHEPRSAETCGERRLDVAAGGGVGAGHEPDRARDLRKRPLALLREQPFRRQCPLESLERGELVTDARPLDRRRTKDELATLLPEVERPLHLELLTLDELEPEPVEPRSLHLDAQRGARLALEREEDGRPGLVAAELTDLALDPHPPHASEVLAQPAVERGHGIDLSPGIAYGVR